MAVINVQKQKTKEVSPEDLIARFCIHFPQYTFQQASKLPYKRIRQMLGVAEKEHARFMYELVQIVAAPHTKKGSGVKKMIEYYKGILRE